MVSRLADIIEIRRTLITTAFTSRQAAHLGGSLSMLDVLNVLFGEYLKFNPQRLDWSERDIFILSKGHCFLGYLSVLHAYGCITSKHLEKFQSDGSNLIAHPIKDLSIGVESSNGSLGQGLSYGLGLAIGHKAKGQSGRRVYVMLGDGECNEGQVWEAATLASERGLNNLIAIVDQNRLRNDDKVTSYGSRGVSLAGIWRAFGWNVIELDGHCLEDIRKAFSIAIETQDAPSVLVCDTIKGKGFRFMEHDNTWHHSQITKKQYHALLSELDRKPPNGD